jgi:hypothetical protein
VIVLRVREIANPSNAAFSLDTALAPCTSASKTWEPERLANLGVYPPDQPTSYTVPVSDTVLGRLRTYGVTDVKDACLQVTLRTLRAPAAAVDVTIDPPEWRAEK